MPSATRNPDEPIGPSLLLVALERYQERFGRHDLTTVFLSPKEQEVAARLMNEAVERGERTSNDALWAALGWEPPPPGAIL